MVFMALLLEILFWIFLIITILGMIRPWWVLWFLDFKNRLSVLKYYGIVTLLLGLGVIVAKKLM